MVSSMSSPPARVCEIDRARIDRVAIAADEQLTTLAKRGTARQRRRCSGPDHAQVAAKLEPGEVVVHNHICIGHQTDVQLQSIGK